VTAGEHGPASSDPAQALEHRPARALEHGPARALEHGPAQGVEHGPAQGPDVLDGPFTTTQLLRLDQALRVADASTGLTFSVYVGDLDEPPRGHAEKLHGQLADPQRSVLLAVSPNQRLLEIVTGADARRRIPDRDAKLAALSMAAAFGGGDLAGGIIIGLDQLASHAGKS
jgi:uncharacterized protein DUF5130